ncbi:hypothetical protein B0H17DRAFT_1212537 [Mycena rosella]|uniref:Uncharacterized protein n=1 Tax=Mycena rosella TaxID=1033263 RepID=A0AAD7CVB0_MYCRO|nr:hypothetical protein B0H17DRAFT_1212537 [Mycena rosella]
MLTPRADSANPPAFSLHRSCPLSSSSARRLSLHPSALSDAERALLTASLADLADTTGSETVDQILRLFAPATTLSSGAFFAALRLVLHAQAGRGVDRGLAFVQSPIPARPPLPLRKLTSPASRTLGATSSSESFLSMSASSASSVPPRRTHHAHSSSLSLAGCPSPPTQPLRRALAQRVPASSSPHIQHFANRTASGGTPRRQGPIQIQTQNPFGPTSPPRRASLCVPTSSPPSPAPFDAARHARGAYPTSAGPRTTSFAPHPPVHPQRRASAFEGGVRRALPSFEWAARRVRLVCLIRVSSDLSSASAHRPARERERTFTSSSASPSNSNCPFSDSTRSEFAGSPTSEREHTPFSAALPLTLPKALRRTLAGAG